jgi:heat shock protein HtpX
MFKRFSFFILMNVLVVASITIITSVFGIGDYITSQGIDYSACLVFCFVWGFVGSFISLMLSKQVAKSFMGVQIVDNISQHSSLVKKVHYLSNKAGLSKMPEVGIFESPEINAFATGPSRNNSLVAVSTGLLNHMKDDEIDGVLGHEVAHISNGDMVTMALIQGVINAFVLFFAKIAAFAIGQATNDDEEITSYGFGTIMVELAFQVFFGFLGMFISAYFSRSREFRADKDGARLAGKQKMTNALKALKRNYETLEHSDVINNKAINCLRISSKNSWLGFISTHPSLDKRIDALEKFRVL